MIYRVLIKFAIIVALLAVLYAHVAQGLVYDWIHMPDFSHGFLIPMVSFYLVYEKRKDLSVLSPSSRWGGFGLIILGILFLFLGNLATEYFTMRFSLIIVIAGIILLLLGKDFYKILLFPLIFLIFMIPLPSILIDRITFPMQVFASKMAASALYLISLPVLRVGNIIQLSNNYLEVSEGCSGIRSLISLLALSVVFAYFSQKDTWKRILLVVSTFPIAIIANATRVTGTGVLAHYYGDSVAQGFFHGFSGLILFVVAFVCLFMVGALLSRIRKVNKGIS
jgi:exosortase